MQARHGHIERNTRETRIVLNLTLDGSGVASVSTGWGFADHMLTLLAFWGGFDLELTCTGDLEVDAHHTLEDVGLCLGQAFFQALGDRKGLRRVGNAKVPMDEAIAEVAVDLSGRPWIVYEDAPLPAVIAGQEKDVWREFFKSFAIAGKFNLHLLYCYGLNGHHLLESACKGLGLALKEATRLERSGVSSTKGSLD